MAGTRVQIVAAFIAFALAIAPFAWKLTQVERVDLPVDRIGRLSWNASSFVTPKPHVVMLHGRSALDYHASVPASPHYEFASHQLDEASEKEWHKYNLHDDLQALDDALGQALDASSTAQASFHIFFLCRADVHVPWHYVIGKYRHAWTTACDLTSGHAKSLKELLDRHVFPPVEMDDLEGLDTSRARVALKYRIQVTLLKENPESAAIERHLAPLVARVLRPMVEELGRVASFAVDYETIHFAKLSERIHRELQGDETIYTIPAEDLTQFTTKNDYMSASVLEDREQVLHLMAAMPDESHSPLRIRASKDKRASLSGAFEIPSWGIVVLLNTQRLGLENGSGKPLQMKEYYSEMQRMMGHFVTQLRLMFGIKEYHARQLTQAKHNNRIVFLPASSHGLAEWEVDCIAHKLFERHSRTTISTLQSIAQLITEWPQMIVLQRVQERVVRSLELIEAILATHVSKLDPIQLQMLLDQARQAAEHADAAYYDHTMIRQLYFPQEQMLGVYAPLLAPLLLPFCVGLLREIKRWKKKKAAKLEKEKQE